MNEVRRSAIKIQQGRRTLFLTSFTVKDFLAGDFYRVDHLDVQSTTGMQRLLNGSRARSFGKDVVDADKRNEAFLPTSVFLATEGSISYDEQNKELYFDSDPARGVCPLDVVDGQHRLEGLKLAAEKSEHLLDFPISVVIAHQMSETEKMLQFVTVNTKQKAVDKGVVQHITARFTQMLDVEHLPYLPGWLRREVDKGGDDRGLRIVKRLNTDKSSPWHGRIQLADESKSLQHTITQSTFVAMLKKTVLNKYHPFNATLVDPDKQLAVLINYWKAVEDIFVGGVTEESGKTASVAYKYNGLEFFLSILHAVINVLSRNRTFTVNAITKCLRDAEDHLPPQAELAMAPDFWRPGGLASEMNRAGIFQLATDFSKAIESAAAEDIEV